MLRYNIAKLNYKKGASMFESKMFDVTFDIARGVNATVWGSAEQAEKVGKIVKTGLSGADVVTGSVTLGCRSVRYYCKQYGTFWGCTVAEGQGIKKVIKFTVKP